MQSVLEEKFNTPMLVGLSLDGATDTFRNIVSKGLYEIWLVEMVEHRDIWGVWE